MDRRTQNLLALLAELQRLTSEDATAARLTLRSDGGDYVGELKLSDRAVEALTLTVRSLANAAEKPPALPYDAPVEFELTDAAQAELDAAKDDLVAWMGQEVPASADIDPLLEAEFEEYCIGLDTDFLVQMAAEDPKAAVAAFDEITADGDL